MVHGHVFSSLFLSLLANYAIPAYFRAQDFIELCGVWVSILFREYALALFMLLASCYSLSTWVAFVILRYLRQKEVVVQYNSPRAL